MDENTKPGTNARSSAPSCRVCALSSVFFDLRIISPAVRTRGLPLSAHEHRLEPVRMVEVDAVAAVEDLESQKLRAVHWNAEVARESAAG